MKGAPGPRRSHTPDFSDSVIRFASFDVDLRAGELRRAGLKVKLSGQPFDVLVALLESPGQVVSREELHVKLWAQDTFVDFEHGLNKAINKVREALGDDADHPRFIETLPRRGYRFLAPVVQPAQVEFVGVQKLPRPDLVEPLSSAPRANTLRRFWLPWTIAFGLSALMAALVLVSTQSPRPPRVIRYVQLTNDGLKKSGVFSAAITTDGSRVYFGEQNAQQRGTIAQVSATGGPISTLTTLEDPNRLALDYSRARSELLISLEIQSPLWALAVPGGAVPRRLGDFLVDGAAWSPDGQSVVYGKVNALYVARADGSDSRKLVSVHGDPESPRWSPDGKLLRFTLNPWDGSQRSLWEVSADGSGLHPLFPDWQTKDDGMGSWTPDGRYFIFTSFLPNGHDGVIMAIGEKKGLFMRGTRKPVALTTGPLSFSGAVPSMDGRQILAGGFLDRGELMRYDLKRHAWEPYLGGISAADLDFSKDGEWVTYVMVPEGTLWRSRVDGSERLQLTLPPLRASMPRWSPDGKRVAFSGQTSGGKWTIYLAPADGGRVEKLVSDDGRYQDPNWSPDGRRLVFGETTWSPKAIRILELESGRVSELPASGELFSPRWSPDGRYIVALTAVLPPWQNPERSNPVPQSLMAFDFEKQTWTQWARAPALEYPAFSRDGKYVYFSGDDQRVYRVRTAGSNIETVANINVSGGMKQDDFWYWTGLAPDDAPLFRDASSEEIYALDVDFP